MSLLLLPQDTDSIYHPAPLYVFLGLRHELRNLKNITAAGSNMKYLLILLLRNN